MPVVQQQGEREAGAGTAAEAVFGGKIVAEGELGCLLVFSDRRHVHYINALLSQLESVLRDRGFRPQRLGEEIRSGEDYLEKLQGLVEESVLGVVILDGFRPNVLFEFGYLMGREKPTIVLMCKDARVSVKTLYRSREDSGLGQKSFDRLLQDPPLDVSFHLSDFGGKHVARMDWESREAEPANPRAVLGQELSKLEDSIIEEAQQVVAREIPATVLRRLLEPLARVVRYYYMDPGRVSTQELRRAHERLVKAAASEGVQLPYDVYTMIGGAYVSRAKIATVGAAKAVECLESALAAYGEASSSDEAREEPKRRADNQRRIGDASWKLAQYRARRDNSRRAVSAYEEALIVYTLEEFPMDYGMTQNNLGNAYGTLAEVEDKGGNCKRAIEAYEEALIVYTLEEFPMQYATTQNNLGVAYRTLAEVEDKGGNCKRAIEAYEEALRAYTLEEFPMDYGMTQNNLGAAYSTLAEVEDKGGNCKRAIEAYEEALSVYTQESSPQQHALVERNLLRLREWMSRDEESAG